MNMKIYILTFLLILVMVYQSIPSEPQAYKLFNTKGSSRDFEDLESDALDADLIFFGELHNNPICHWLQLELVKSMYSKLKGETTLILGAEMFENDDQIKLNEYLSGIIPQKNFEEEAKLWKNYKTDYKPLVDFAKDSNLQFIATNIPRRYAAVVARKGMKYLDSLDNDARRYLPPLPIMVDMTLPSYKKMQEEMKGSHGMAYIAEAQAIKDATMAYFLLKYWKKGSKMIHFNGSFHTDNYEGIVWFVQKAVGGIKIITIATVEQDDIEELKEESKGLGDYILVIPSKMTKTH